MSRIDSYDRKAVRPVVGTLWVWEPESAPALIKVTSVRWNGEEWWVGTSTLLEESLPDGLRTTSRECWNDLSRFWEASHYVRAIAGYTPRISSATRSGDPHPDEMEPAA